MTVCVSELRSVQQNDGGYCTSGHVFVEVCLAAFWMLHKCVSLEVRVWVLVSRCCLVVHERFQCQGAFF